MTRKQATCLLIAVGRQLQFTARNSSRLSHFTCCEQVSYCLPKVNVEPYYTPLATIIIAVPCNILKYVAMKLKYKMATPQMSLLERLEAKSIKQPSGCWEWQGFRLRGQHGVMTFKYRHTYVHRLAWEHFNGPIPGDMCVCHKCDNPPCWNPDHLFLGTDADNSRDSVQKGRNAFGVRNGHAKLTEEDVIAITKLYVPGQITMREVAERFNISVTLAYNVIRGKRWKQCSREAQTQKVRQPLLIEFNGKTQSAQSWADELGLDPGIIRARIWKGFSPEQALSIHHLRYGYRITSAE